MADLGIFNAFGSRCPHCNTFFKVYPDQLRLHNGYANCGQCGQTFDVQANLIHLPPHETVFLEKSQSVIDGLPVLNAVVQAHYKQVQPTAKAAQVPKQAPEQASIKTQPEAATSAVEKLNLHITPTAAASEPVTKKNTAHGIEDNTKPKVERVVPPAVLQNKASNQKLPTLSFVPAPDLNTPDNSSAKKAKKSAASKLLSTLFLLVFVSIFALFASILFMPEFASQIAHIIPQTQPWIEQMQTWHAQLMTLIRQQ